MDSNDDEDLALEDDLADAITSQLEIISELVGDPASLTIARGSDLNFPGQPRIGEDRLPSLLWRGLATAGEHMAMVHAQHVAEQNAVRTKPYYTLARTVTLGAAKAIYVLEPDDREERRIRALRLLLKDDEDGLALARDIKREIGENADPDFVAGFEETERRIAALHAELVSQGAVKKDHYITETRLLQRCAHYLGATPNPEASISNAWRVGSGFAHARSWAWDTGIEDEPAVVQFVVIWSTPVQLMNVAWRLWDKRRGGFTPEFPRAAPGEAASANARFGITTSMTTVRFAWPTSLESVADCEWEITDAEVAEGEYVAGSDFPGVQGTYRRVDDDMALTMRPNDPRPTFLHEGHEAHMETWMQNISDLSQEVTVAGEVRDASSNSSKRGLLPSRTPFGALPYSPARRTHPAVAWWLSDDACF